MGHVDFPPDVVMKALLDLTSGAIGSPIFAFRSVGTLPPNQVRPAATLRQATMANGQSLALSNGRVLAAADSRLRWLVGAQVLGNWDLNWSRLVLDPSGQVGVLEEIGWKR